MVSSYSNPRLNAAIDDWPFGDKRTTASFVIESRPTHGERAVRTVINPQTGKPFAARKTTYAPQVRIVDGDDGGLYIAELRDDHGFIDVRPGSLQGCETIHNSDDPRYAELRAALFDCETEATECPQKGGDRGRSW